MPIINNISFSYTEFKSSEELNQEDRELVLSARKAALNAYAPYSKFKVGAAVRLESGKVVCGANVENAAFPSGICAEQNVLSNSLSNHPDDHIIAIAISAQTEEGITDNPVPPCGKCRQVLAEEESRNGRAIRLILSGRTKTLLIESVNSLLPLQFNKKNLEFILP